MSQSGEKKPPRLQKKKKKIEYSDSPGAQGRAGRGPRTHGPLRLPQAAAEPAVLRRAGDGGAAAAGGGHPQAPGAEGGSNFRSALDISETRFRLYRHRSLEVNVRDLQGNLLVCSSVGECSEHRFER